MIDDIIVIDDAISKARQLEIEELCKDKNFTWAYGAGSIRPSDIDRYSFATSDLALNVPQMYNELYIEQEVVQPLSLAFLPVLSAMPYTIDVLIKMKINLTLPAIGANEHTYGMPHTDFPNVPNNITALYYINDSDGDTVIFNELQGHRGQLTEKARVSPKQGRLVVFKGNMIHAGNNPRTNEPRLVANINFIPYMKK
jgi:hypothetical protein